MHESKDLRGKATKDITLSQQIRMIHDANVQRWMKLKLSKQRWLKDKDIKWFDCVVVKVQGKIKIGYILYK